MPSKVKRQVKSYAKALKTAKSKKILFSDAYADQVKAKAKRKALINKKAWNKAVKSSRGK